MSIASLLEEGKVALEAGDRQRALSIFLPLANGGESQAQYYLGVLFSGGREGEFDKAEAIRWFEASLLQGNPYAAYELGQLYNPYLQRGGDHFNVPPNDEAKSQQFYRQAVEGLRSLAEKGEVKASAILGWMYLSGQGVEPNAQEVIYWHTLSFDNGGYGAANTLWNLFSGGYFFADVYNEEQAVYWFRKMKEHRCQCLVDYRWEEKMVSKGLLAPSEMSRTPGTSR